MPLEKYREKRDFSKTSEPAGTPAEPHERLSYVIQKHSASRLHWDFRIELDGVLLSWAVPKGPSFDTADKRLAMHVEDHPIDYGAFEGTIPKGEYGGGTVMIWDRGWWEPFEGDAADAKREFDKGALKMVLHGERLQGRWVLVRTRGYGGAGKDSWLLIKEHDGNERNHTDFDPIVEWNTSAASGRTMDEIAQGNAVWHSKKVTQGTAVANEVADAVRTSKTGSTTRSERTSADVAAESASDRDVMLELAKLPGAKKAERPRSQKPELATLVTDVPTTDEWLHEIKFDGYRILASVGTSDVRLISRNGKDWTERFESVGTAVLGILGDHTALLDGEVVVLKPDGTSSFQLLQNMARHGAHAELIYYVFDVLNVDGWDLRGCALTARKRVLESLLPETASGQVRRVEHIVGRGHVFFDQACQRNLEGVVSKRVTSTYREGRQREWRKSKCLVRQEFNVVGYTDPGGARLGFGALVLGIHDGARLRLAGRVGTGFTEASLAEILARLKGLHRETPPVDDPPKGTAARGIHWVEPELVADVSFTEWTEEGQLRHPSFHGLRDDKSPDEVVVERAVAEIPSTAKPGRPEPVHFAGVKITNPDRVFWPDVDATKIEAMRYYEAVAELMLPHVARRPLSLVRCPGGYTGECFFQKHIEHFPDSVGTVDIFEPDEKRSVPYACVTNLAGLVGLVQMGVLEIHPWGSRADDPLKPDRIVFDLDPDVDLPFSQVATTALLLRSELSHLGIESWLKTTGGKGLHVTVPITRTRSWDEVKDFSHAFVESIVALDPRAFTSSMSKSKRGGRIFIDYLRNARGATAIAPYSTRARPGAPVSVPLAWDEIDGLTERIEFDIRSLTDRIGAPGFKDPWADMGSARQSITNATLKRLGLRASNP